MNIEVGKKIGRSQNLYRLGIEFMLGDADGKKIVNVDIPKHEINSSKTESLLNVLEKMLKEDRKRRGGIQDVNKLWRYYKEEIEVDIRYYFDVYVDEDEDEDEEKLIPITEEEIWFAIEYPCDGNSGFFYSVDNLTLTYFDEDGIEYETNFNK